jgi:hypothetical protein
MKRTRKTFVRFAAVTVVSTAAVGTLATPSYASLPTGPASLTPATGTPHFPATTTPTEQVRQLAECGSTMYAVGTFTEVRSGSTPYTRSGAFSFSATAPYTITSWDPEVSGTVNSIAFDGTDCSHAYLVGSFSSVGGVAVKNIADVDTTTGALAPGFKANVGGQVDTILGWNGHLFVGGKFTSIAGGTADPYFASLNPATGKNDGYLNLNVSGTYVYTDKNGNPSGPNVTRIFNQQLSHDGTKLLVEGVFTSIGDQPRRQIAMLNLGPTGATTDAWYPTEFNANCAVDEPFYTQDAAWSVDDKTIFTATTGYKPATGSASNSSWPRAGLCDSAAAFPATAAQVSHKWINYTGCDSLFSTVADSSTPSAATRPDSGQSMHRGWSACHPRWETSLTTRPVTAVTAPTT